MADKMSIDKKDSVKEDSDESIDSSPEAEQCQAALNTQEGQQPKRKGGRKPIYATSEERKQRNRQAQAAFRERRTEYIKQLEEAIKVHESNLQSLQTAHRGAADECLMLRYKCSLLERILLEKGIDVQAELQAKAGTPNLGPTHVPQNLVQPPTIQRAMMNRHHQSRRSNSSIAPKIEPGASPVTAPLTQSSAASPKNRPTPSTHSNSPTNAATGFVSQPALSPAASDHVSIRSHSSLPPIMKPQMSPLPMVTATTRPPALPPTSAVRTAAASAFYPTPGFQNHIEQLEQEYDAPADLMDDSDVDTPSGPGPYPSAFSDGPRPTPISPTTSTSASHLPSPVEMARSSQSSSYPSMTQLLDGGIDWDPFGLSASMAFPSPFAFDQSNMR